jgi:hypothetical protein
MYERAKNLAEKESEACLECLAKIDQVSHPQAAGPLCFLPQPRPHVLASNVRHLC